MPNGIASGILGVPGIQGSRLNRREIMFCWIIFSVLLIGVILFLGITADREKIGINLTESKLPPSPAHLFGTDWLGRDMFTRTAAGLVLSIRIGFIASAVSICIAAVFGTCSALLGPAVDSVITWLADLFFGIPHLVLLILISIAMGGGARGVAIGVAVTHWPNVTRIIRAEVMQLRNTEYIQIARRMGKSWGFIALKHIFPHIFPQLMIGLILLFPHAILHEASITFLGYGLNPETPAVGIILADSMKYLSSGMWWLAVLPGLTLIVTVRLFGILGDSLRQLVNPETTQL
ncbi:MAG: ABC transporter permease [Treponema sp.]|jgi:peptide/nickel transport system permease protein|nr:ABC transporter permease [Treponema sp.]